MSRRSSHPHGPSLEDHRPWWRWLALALLILILAACYACWHTVQDARRAWLGPGLRRGESTTESAPVPDISAPNTTGLRH